MTKDYYAILAVDRDASQEAIKQAYRRLARELHPDVNRAQDAEDRFKEINEAYAVLSDPNRRAQFDRYGTVDQVPVPDVRDIFGSFDDLFEMFFGGSRPGRRAAAGDGPVTGADLRYDLELSLEEAATGVERPISIERLETCTTCFGTGREPGSTPETCPTCRGSGQIRHQQQTVFGYFTQVVTCRECAGRGTIVRRPCQACRGAGRSEVAREIHVKIPPGVETGTALRIPGEGEGGVHGGGRGDLYVVIRVRPHDVFRRDGADLYAEASISMVQAALGDEITVPGLGGPNTIAIPPGTQPGARLRLRGQGMPVMGGGRGDLYVRLNVEIPKQLTPDQRDLLLRLSTLRGERVRPQQPSLWKKMKDLFQ